MAPTCSICGGDNHLDVYCREATSIHPRVPPFNYNNQPLMYDVDPEKDQHCYESAQMEHLEYNEGYYPSGEGFLEAPSFYEGSQMEEVECDLRENGQFDFNEGSFSHDGDALCSQVCDFGWNNQDHQGEFYPSNDFYEVISTQTPNMYDEAYPTQPPQDEFNAQILAQVPQMQQQMEQQKEQAQSQIVQFEPPPSTQPPPDPQPMPLQHDIKAINWSSETSHETPNLPSEVESIEDVDEDEDGNIENGVVESCEDELEEGFVLKMIELPSTKSPNVSSGSDNVIRDHVVEREEIRREERVLSTPQTACDCFILEFDEEEKTKVHEFEEKGGRPSKKVIPTLRVKPKKKVKPSNKKLHPDNSSMEMLKRLLDGSLEEDDHHPQKSESDKVTRVVSHSRLGSPFPTGIG